MSTIENPPIVEPQELLEEYDGTMLSEQELCKNGFKGGRSLEHPSCNNKELLSYIIAQDGYKLSDRYYEIAKNVGTVENAQKNDTVNVPINASGLATSFGVLEKTIKRDLYVLRDLNLIRYVGSNKTGHWELINQQK